MTEILTTIEYKKLYNKVVRALRKENITIGYHQEIIFQNLIAAADILSARELRQMIRDYK